MTPSEGICAVATTSTGYSSGYLVEHAYGVIREKILSGEFEAGQWLRESDLANVAGVSRTPVREALRRLTAEGLVAHERNRGVQVQSWTEQDLNEIFGLRSLLEPWAAAQAAARGEADLDQLVALTDAMESEIDARSPDLAKVTDLNNRFHNLVLEGSGNARLCMLVASVILTPLVRRTFSHYQPDRLRLTIYQHREVINAIRAGDAMWAESIMRAHIHRGWVEMLGGKSAFDPTVSGAFHRS